MAQSFKLVVCVSGLGTVATADQVQSFLVEQGYNHPHRIAADEGNGIFTAGVAIEGSQRRILNEVGRWEPESGDLVAAVTEVIGHDDWQAIVAVGMPVDTAGVVEEACGCRTNQQSGATVPCDAHEPHTGQYL